MSMDMDGDLIEQTLSGDSRAFERLYTRYHPRIYAVLAQRLDDRDAVEDLVQTTFLRAFRSLHTFRGGAAFSTWLTQIALNVFRTHLRSRQARRNWLVETEDPEGVPGVIRPEALSGSPERALQDRERRALVRKGILSLPTRYRRAM